jgi:hypothetical protein
VREPGGHLGTARIPSDIANARDAATPARRVLALAGPTATA